MTPNDKIFLLHADIAALDSLVRQSLNALNVVNGTPVYAMLTASAALLKSSTLLVIQSMRAFDVFANYNTAELASTMPTFRATHPSNVSDICATLRMMHSEIASKCTSIATALNTLPPPRTLAASFTSAAADHINLVNSLTSMQNLPKII